MSLLDVEMDELERVRKRQVRELARGVLGHPERSTLERSTEADVSVRLRGHERMFSWIQSRSGRGVMSDPPT